MRRKRKRDFETRKREIALRPDATQQTIRSPPLACHLPARSTRYSARSLARTAARLLAQFLYTSAFCTKAPLARRSLRPLAQTARSPLARLPLARRSLSPLLAQRRIPCPQPAHTARTHTRRTLQGRAESTHCIALLYCSLYRALLQFAKTGAVF